MARRRSVVDRFSGNILDHCPPGFILDKKEKPKPASDPLCCCRSPEANRVGGQHPMIRWRKDGSGLEAYCITCGKHLRSGFHRQRRAVHALGLCKLPMEHLDLEDAVDAGLMLPEHLERPGSPSPELVETGSDLGRFIASPATDSKDEKMGFLHHAVPDPRSKTPGCLRPEDPQPS